MQKVVNVVGAGLAGVEAAWVLANAGIKVRLFEMRPKYSTEAHKSSDFAELVCSNSLRSNQLVSGVGLLKAEMRLLDSLVIAVADQTCVPAGSALAVDRDVFSQKITNSIKMHENIEVIYDKVTHIPEGPTIIASGPLTAPELSTDIQRFCGEEYLYFYDAAAPIIAKDSIDFSKAYYKSRYDKGDADYINCPMTAAEYSIFYQELIHADVVPLKEFEKEIYFEGCMPVEVMASRGEKTLLFGPLKPVGLRHPVTEERAYAVLQLRQDNVAATLYNIVGFQTHLKWPEQKRVLQLVPGLENCEIVRYGVMHRNTFLNAPKVLYATYQSKQRADLFFAGQITGVEGYVESAASGIVAGLNMLSYLFDTPAVIFPTQTMIGAQANYISHADSTNFQPMNANFGVLPELEIYTKKKERKQAYADRALQVLQDFLAK
ncbi:methylenetetrahydrofolate--tRNA-(uracil-5-)-methyltransferase TrmFO [Erysipelotrichaceae bacterium]|nr:methylenetetrahydrofolate--tRNA-(uracil-5-)-methyltransferase TrmFO [Erysipelotrichaceae bacterium]